WLECHPVPAGVPALVVGTDPGRRTAMQLVTHGASDYFALPDDLEIFRVPEYLDRVPEYLRATTSPSRTISRYSGTRSPPRSTPPGRGPQGGRTVTRTRSPPSWARARPSRRIWPGRPDSCHTATRAP